MPREPLQRGLPSGLLPYPLPPSAGNSHLLCARTHDGSTDTHITYCPVVCVRVRARLLLGSPSASLQHQPFRLPWLCARYPEQLKGVRPHLGPLRPSDAWPRRPA